MSCTTFRIVLHHSAVQILNLKSVKHIQRIKLFQTSVLKLTSKAFLREPTLTQLAPALLLWVKGSRLETLWRPPLGAVGLS